MRARVPTRRVAVGSRRQRLRVHLCRCHRRLGKVLRAASWMGKGAKPSRRRQLSTAKPAAGASETRRRRRRAAGTDRADIELPMLSCPTSGRGGGGAGERGAGCGARQRWDAGVVRGSSLAGAGVGAQHELRRVEGPGDGVGPRVSSAGSGSTWTPSTLSAPARAGFVRTSADEVGVEDKVLKRDLGRVFMARRGVGRGSDPPAQEPADTTVRSTPTSGLRRSSCCATRSWWIGSPTTSPGWGWSARRPTAWSATWPRSAASWPGPSP